MSRTWLQIQDLTISKNRFSSPKESHTDEDLQNHHNASEIESGRM